MSTVGQEAVVAYGIRILLRQRLRLRVFVCSHVGQEARIVRGKEAVPGSLFLLNFVSSLIH